MCGVALLYPTPRWSMSPSVADWYTRGWGLAIQYIGDHVLSAGGEKEV